MRNTMQRKKPRYLGNQPNPESDTYLYDMQTQSLAQDLHDDPMGRGRVPSLGDDYQAKPDMELSPEDVDSLSRPADMTFTPEETAAYADKFQAEKPDMEITFDDIAAAEKPDMEITFDDVDTFDRMQPQAPQSYKRPMSTAPQPEVAPAFTPEPMPGAPDYAVQKPEDETPPSEWRSFGQQLAQALGRLAIAASPHAGGHEAGAEAIRRMSDRGIAIGDKYDADVSDYMKRKRESAQRYAQAVSDAKRQKYEDDLGRRALSVADSDRAERRQDSARARGFEDEDRARAKYERSSEYQDEQDKRSLELTEDQLKLRNKYDIAKARALRVGKGGGAGLRARQLAALQTGMDALAAQYGGADKIPPAMRERVRLEASSQNPEVRVGGLLKETQTRTDPEKRSAKAIQSEEHAKTTMVELESMLKRVNQFVAEADAGKRSQYLPGMEPITQPGYKLQRARAKMGIPAAGSNMGLTGLTPEENILDAGGKMVGSAMFHAATHQSANLMAEQEKAEALIRNNGTLKGMKQALEEALVALRNKHGIRDLETGVLMSDDDMSGMPEAPEMPETPEGGYVPSGYQLEQ